MRSGDTPEESLRDRPKFSKPLKYLNSPRKFLRKDSSEYEMAGGRRKSERQKRTRRVNENTDLVQGL
ncbi:MAG: hypothetical protein ACFB8W_00895 [Elainellaceae cyanobacterium]